MHSDRIPESTKQWLQNEDFILWCLAPTQESEEWWVNYQKEHPEDQASLQEARKIILSARLNPVQRLPQRSAELNGRVTSHLTNGIAKLGDLFGRWFSSAGNERETVDVLGFIVFRLSETFFSGKEIVNLGFSLVVRGLCTPFTVFRASAGLGVDDGTHVEFVRSTCDGNLMRGGI